MAIWQKIGASTFVLNSAFIGCFFNEKSTFCLSHFRLEMAMLSIKLGQGHFILHFYNSACFDKSHKLYVLEFCSYVAFF
jgi:hypothetical protein